MSGKSSQSPIAATPLRAERRGGIGIGMDEKSSISRAKREMQIVRSSSSSPSFSTLPDGWFVEERPRPSRPSHVDRYYYEPGTRRQFRSLSSVQRYLAQQSPHTHTKSNEQHTTCIEPGSGQRFRSLRAVDKFLSGENACTATPRSAVKSGNRKQRACGLRSYKGAVHKRSSVAEEDNTPMASKQHTVQSIHSKKSNSTEKISSAKDGGASMHNLTAPPAKVSWVLSGPGGVWSPYLDDSIVPESEKLKWSEAFVLSIHEGVFNGLHS